MEILFAVGIAVGVVVWAGISLHQHRKKVLKAIDADDALKEVRRRSRWNNTLRTK